MIHPSLRFRKLSTICASACFLVCSLVILGATQTAFGATISHTVCDHEADPNPRIIEVNYLTSQGTVPCSVDYTKDKKNNTIATYKTSRGECARVEKSIITNLSKGGWTCGPSLVSTEEGSKIISETDAKTIPESASKTIPKTAPKASSKTDPKATTKTVPETALTTIPETPQKIAPETLSEKNPDITLGIVPEKNSGIFNYHSSPPQQFTEDNSFAVILEVFPDEENAHLFVKMLKEKFPEFTTHIYKLSSKKKTWVVIGASFLSMNSALSIETRFKDLNIGNPATIDLRGIAPNPGLIEKIKLQG